jgi:hypothetical protein
VYNDMAKDQSDFEPTRCDASFMTGTLDKEDIDALQQAVAFLRKLADGCKSASEMPLLSRLLCQWTRLSTRLLLLRPSQWMQASIR